jgi:ornithine lipid ester-linked acyl 2-hydroxylase
LKHNKRMWFAYFSSSDFRDEPNFFESSDLTWAEQIISKSDAIKAEVEALMGTSFFTAKGYFIEGLTDNEGWKTFSLKTWGIEVKHVIQKLPILADIASGNKNIVSVSINVLHPNSKIKEHHGDSNTFYRSHLGINIPGGLPSCGFKVNDESREWKEGELLTFTDGNLHAAWNLNESRRVIVVFDVIKDEFHKRRRYICFRVRTFLILQLLFEKSIRFKNSPMWFHRIVGVGIFFTLVGLYPYQKIFGVIKKHN